MSRWPRLVFVGYAISVLVGVAWNLWPFPSSLFEQWRSDPADGFEFGPIQSNDNLLRKVAVLAKASSNGPLAPGPSQKRAQTEISFKIPRAEGARFPVRSLAVDDGTFYFASGDWFYAVASDGSLRWSFRPGAASLASIQVVFSKELVFTSSDNGSIYCFSKTGKLEWVHRLGSSKSNLQIAYAGSNIIAATASRNGTQLQALSATDGHRQWISDFALPSSLIGLTASDTKIAIYFSNSYSVIDAVSGESLSAHDLVDGISSAAFSAELDLLVAKSHDGKYRAIKASTGQLMWTRAPSKATTDWISEIVRRDKVAGFWALAEGNRAVFRDVRNGNETEVIHTKYELENYAALDMDSLVIARVDRPGLLRIR